MQQKNIRTEHRLFHSWNRSLHLHQTSTVALHLIKYVNTLYSFCQTYMRCELLLSIARSLIRIMTQFSVLTNKKNRMQTRALRIRVYRASSKFITLSMVCEDNHFQQWNETPSSLQSCKCFGKSVPNSNPIENYLYQQFIKLISYIVWM